MVTVKIDNFGGIAPRQHPTLLADGMAVTAHNCRLKTGKLVPLREPLKLGANIVNLEGGLSRISEAHTLYPWLHAEYMEFLAFAGVCDVARGNLADDEYDRLFISGETGISWRDTSVTPAKAYENVPVVYMRKGETDMIVRYPLPKAVLPRVNARLVKGTVSEMDTMRYTRFFQTWVDPYGYESGFSEASYTWNPNAHGPGSGDYVDEDFTYNDGDEVSIQALTEDQVPDGGGTLTNPTAGYKRRIYKVITGAEEGRAQFIAEFASNPWGAQTVRVKDEDAGEVMPEMESVPTDLRNLVYVPGNFYAGVSAAHPKTVAFSEVDMPSSWPVKYRYDVEDRIVALAANENSVFVLTEGYPFVISGTAPESMSVAKLAGVAAACVSRRSVCLVKNACCYASNIGICMIAPDPDYGTIVRNITDDIWTKEQWQALNPKSCVMGQHDGALFMHFSLEDGTHKGFSVDLMDDKRVAVTTHDEVATCLCVDAREDKLYFVREGV